ncbi:MAG TPA: ATP synthase F0 subunit B [Pyrinomonadaceae bacterium]|jgi:F-type H+-transporting ATPase subunit b
MVFLAFAENSIQLVPDGTIFFHIFLILLMIWILNRTLFKPINRILEARERMTGGSFAETTDTLRQADEKLANYETTLREARAAGYAVVENTRRESLAQRQLQIDEVKADVVNQIEREKADLNRQVAQARQTLASDARGLAERITAQVLRQRSAA